MIEEDKVVEIGNYTAEQDIEEEDDEVDENIEDVEDVEANDDNSMETQATSKKGKKKHLINKNLANILIQFFPL